MVSFLGAHSFAHVDCYAKVIKHDCDLVTLDEDRVLLFTLSFTIYKWTKKKHTIWTAHRVVCVMWDCFTIPFILTVCKKGKGKRINNSFYLNAFFITTFTYKSINFLFAHTHTLRFSTSTFSFIFRIDSFYCKHVAIVIFITLIFQRCSYSFLLNAKNKNNEILLDFYGA